MCQAALKMSLPLPGKAIRTRRDTLRFFCLWLVQVNAASAFLRKNKTTVTFNTNKITKNQYVNIICMIF
ncbi:MAG TPA: hypothetical protein DFK21_05435 [Salmonella bongori]|uniref:Uncharacterized protein n=1 Tax=Salmonella bongori serovar 66:z41:- str. SA19983605 TaxID=1243617 RepID=A0A248KA11_SALBN|nr:hypothetical protein LFZ56_13095 [Salmonella bongori serovar 66:z41:- str. SA19983605]ECC9750782.1 hypothetical protein [Salmonella bongori]HAD93072.1 hypothetical protein [Salmonella bongori]HBD17194.1 hypothetical protein [Salmonella bongori]HCI32966.1 hypothetical protein [Salmonella bongori]